MGWNQIRLAIYKRNQTFLLGLAGAFERKSTVLKETFDVELKKASKKRLLRDA